MVDMLILDGRDERLAFLGLDGILTATCCPNPVGFLTGPAFNRFSLQMVRRRCGHLSDV